MAEPELPRWNIEQPRRPQRRDIGETGIGDVLLGERREPGGRPGAPARSPQSSAATIRRPRPARPLGAAGPAVRASIRLVQSLFHPRRRRAAAAPAGFRPTARRRQAPSAQYRSGADVNQPTPANGATSTGPLIRSRDQIVENPPRRRRDRSAGSARTRVPGRTTIGRFARSLNRIAARPLGGMPRLPPRRGGDAGGRGGAARRLQAPRTRSTSAAMRHGDTTPRHSQWRR